MRRNIGPAVAGPAGPAATALQHICVGLHTRDSFVEKCKNL